MFLASQEKVSAKNRLYDYFFCSGLVNEIKKKSISTENKQKSINFFFITQTVNERS